MTTLFWMKVFVWMLGAAACSHYAVLLLRSLRRDPPGDGGYRLTLTAEEMDNAVVFVMGDGQFCKPGCVVDGAHRVPIDCYVPAGK